jgi:limonene-1,2-epoxide hydrolase
VKGKKTMNAENEKIVAWRDYFDLAPLSKFME